MLDRASQAVLPGHHRAVGDGAAHVGGEAGDDAEIGAPAHVGNRRDEDLPRLVYTERVVDETMRLFPPVWTMGREAVQDTEIGGYNVPKGTTVYLPQWATVEGLTLYAVDGTNSCTVPSVNAWLYRVPIVDAVLTHMAGVATSGASSAMQTPTDSTISSAVIDNLFYRYFVRVDFCSSTHEFYAVEIDYTE